MAANILQEPVANYQTLTAFKPPPPWGFVAAEIVRLLRTYSTGLSIAIGADEITAAWKAHQARPKRPLVYTGTIVRILPQPPELWLILVQDGSYIAMYPNTIFLKRFKTGTVISFAARDARHYEKRMNGFYPDIVELVRRTFRKDSAASRGDYTALKESELEERTSNLHSPADIGKFPHAHIGPQPADTPSQERSSVDPADRVTTIALSTIHILFDLSSISTDVLGLPEPMHSFTLQRVWNERCLTPLWIFAVVVDLELDKDCQVRLQDPSYCDITDQPSVLWKPPREFQIALSVLRPGFSVLLNKPVIQPTGDSFEVFCNQDTACFYTAQEGCAEQTITSGVYVAGSKETTVTQKRRRVDTVLSKMDSVVDTRSVSTLVNRTWQPKFVTHARVVGIPIATDPLVMTIPCDHEVSFKVTGVEMMRRAACIVVGDEVLLRNVEWVVSCDESSTPSGAWVAGSVDNLSMMTGILNSPIARRISPLRDCVATCVPFPTNHSRTKSRIPGFVTFHVLVYVQKVEACEETKQVRFKVSDGSHTNDYPTHAMDKFYGTGERLQQITDRGQVANKSLDVVLPKHHFRQVFECRDGPSFWESNYIELIKNSTHKLQRGRWLMTLTCYPLSSKKPCVRAFVPYQW